MQKKTEARTPLSEKEYHAGGMDWLKPVGGVVSRVTLYRRAK